MRQPRIREGLSKEIERIALRVATANDSDLDSREAASSLLRSLFPARFLEHLAEIVTAGDLSLDSIDRIVLHLTSINHDILNLKGVAHAKELLQRAVWKLVEVDRTIAEETVGAIFASLVSRGAVDEAVYEGDIGAVYDNLYRRVIENTHDLPTFLETAMNRERYEVRLSDWNSQYVEIFRDMQRSVAAMTELLKMIDTSGDAVLSAQASYFVTGQFGDDISAFPVLLLAYHKRQSWAEPALEGLVKRLRAHCIGFRHETPTLKRLLDEGSFYTVTTAVEDMVSDMKALLSDDLATTVDIPGAPIGNRCVMVPRTLWTRVVNAIASNLERYAVSGRRERSGRLLVSVRASVLDPAERYPSVEIAVLNNGPGVASNEPSVNSRRIAHLLSICGGEFLFPRNLEGRSDGMKVETRVRLRTLRDTHMMKKEPRR